MKGRSRSRVSPTQHLLPGLHCAEIERGCPANSLHHPTAGDSGAISAPARRFDHKDVIDAQLSTAAGAKFIQSPAGAINPVSPHLSHHSASHSERLYAAVV